jgi:hypothetical protein
MKRLNLERGKEELNSTGGNHLCGHFLRELAREHLPKNFQIRLSDAISDHDILLTLTGMLYDAEENFAHFAQESFNIKRNLRRHCSGKSKATQAKARTSTLVSSIISAPAEPSP